MLLLPTNANKTSSRSSLLATRRGTILVAVLVALGAGLLLFAFISNYRDAVAGEGEAARVLVANGLIPKGSPGETLATERMFRSTTVRADQLKEGAITDPAVLRGNMTVRDVIPGQQLMVTDLAPARDAVGSKLSGQQRAISVPVDAQHGLQGPLAAGDRVDVLVGFNTESGGIGRPVVKKILHDVLVLRASGGAEGEKAQNVILRVPGRYAAHLAFAADNGKIWLTMRPGVGVKEAPEDIISYESILFGEKAVKIRASGR